jgi:hypothetical protein
MAKPFIGQLAQSIPIYNPIAADCYALGPYRARVVAKTASYTIHPHESGTIFIGNSASQVNFTLPTASDGLVYEIISLGAGGIKITSAPADKMVILNDAAADSVAFATNNEKIGGGFKVVSDGTLWYALPMRWEGQTETTAT